MKKSNLIKVITVVLASVMLLSLVGCGNNSGTNNESTAPSVAPDTSADASAPAEQKEAEEITLRIGAGQTPQGFTWIESVTEYFMPYVDEKLAETGNYKVNWVEAWGGTVAKVDEIFEAVENGMLDIGWVGNVFEASKLPVNNLSYHVPFNVRAADVDQMATAMLDMYDKYPELKGEYEKYNNKILGLTVLESYNLATNFEVTSMDDLNGKKIGAAGANLTWFQGTGAVAVQSPGTEAYSSIQTGVYEGTLQHTLMLDTLKLYEVAPYITLGDFGSIWGGALTINMDVFNGLPEEVQQALIGAGDAYTQGTVELEKEKVQSYKENMEAKGAKVSVLSDEQRKKWADSLDNLPAEYGKTLDDMGYDGTQMMKDYVNFLKEAGADMPRDWFAE